MSAFSALLRPELIDFPLQYGGRTNLSGFQGAHVIAKKLWDDLKLTSLLNFSSSPRDSIINGMLLPETTRGGAMLGVSTHRNEQSAVYDKLWYDRDGGIGDKGFLGNLIEEFRVARSDALMDGPDAVRRVEAEYKFKLAVFMDFVKIQHIEQKYLGEIAKNLGGAEGDLNSLGYNDNDHRPGTLDKLDEYDRDGTFANIEDNAVFKSLAKLRAEKAGLNVDDNGRLILGAGDAIPNDAKILTDIQADILDKAPQYGRIYFPDGNVQWTPELQADYATRHTIANEIATGAEGPSNKFDRDTFDQRVKSNDFEAAKAKIQNLLSDKELFPDLDGRSFTLPEIYEQAFVKAKASGDVNLMKKVANSYLDVSQNLKIITPDFYTSTIERSKGSFAKIVDTLDKIGPDGDGIVSNVDGGVKTKVAFGLASVALAAVSVEYKFKAARLEAEERGEELSFTDFLKQTVTFQNVALGVGAVGAMVLLAATGPVGATIVLAANVAFGFIEFKEFLGNYIKVTKADLAQAAGIDLDQDGNLPDDFDVGALLPVAEFVFSLMDQFADAIAGIFKDGKDLIKSIIPEIVSASGDDVVYQYEDKMWLLGHDESILIGSEENTFAVHTGYGEVYGGDGDDFLVAWAPDFIPKGADYKGGKAEEDLYLTIDGGAGRTNCCPSNMCGLSP